MKTGAEGESNRSGLPTVIVVRLVEPTQLADGADPLVHLLLSLGYKIKSAIGRLDVKHKAVLELLPLKSQAGVHLLAAVQVDDPDGFLGVVVLVVLQHIRVTAHTAAAEYEPAFLPCLGNEIKRHDMTSAHQEKAHSRLAVQPNHMCVSR